MVLTTSMVLTLDSWYRIGTPESHTYERSECCPYAGFFWRSSSDNQSLLPILRCGMGLYRHVSPHLEYSNALQCITVYCSTVRYSALFIKYSSVLKVHGIALQNGLVRPDAALCPLLSPLYNTALHTEHITQCIALHTVNSTVYFTLHRTIL